MSKNKTIGNCNKSEALNLLKKIVSSKLYEYLKSKDIKFLRTFLCIECRKLKLTNKIGTELPKELFNQIEEYSVNYFQVLSMVIDYYKLKTIEEKKKYLEQISKQSNEKITKDNFSDLLKNESLEFLRALVEDQKQI